MPSTSDEAVVIGDAYEPPKPKLKDDKWYGIPPKGDLPMEEHRVLSDLGKGGRWRFAIELIVLILIEMTIWGVYRYITASYLEGFGTIKFNLFHIFFAPTLALTPIILYWKLWRKEKGLPWKFHRRNIFTGIIMGLVFGVLWRISEMFVYDLIGGAAGTYKFGTLDFYSQIPSLTVITYLLMTFTQFFVVGPVEEMEFRGFLHDQESRAMPQWAALIISSVLFGMSHIPIALFVYKMTPWQLVVAEIGWMSAGAAFGAMYILSRNLWACIVMHGIGNWVLSIFFFSSQLDPAGYTFTKDLYVGTATSLINNALFVGIFYLFFRFYWRPRLEGHSPLKGALAGLDRIIVSFDHKHRSIPQTMGVLVVFWIMILGTILGITYAAGETNIAKVYGIEIEVMPAYDFSKYTVTTESQPGTGELAEGESQEISLASSPDKLISTVTVTLTWTDEPDQRIRLRQYENTPDSFGLSIDGPNSNLSTSTSGENPTGGQGMPQVSIAVPEEALAETMEANYTVTITMESAGMYLPAVGPGVIGYVDDGNAYEYTIDVEYMVPPEAGGK
jgi:membrane protease YdiL (CAAX protease family)